MPRSRSANTRRSAVLALAGLGSLSLAPSVRAQSEKVTRFILPNATGSGVDTITRSASAALGRALGSSVVVENQPGAGGIVGLQALSRTAPDGYALSVVSNNVVIFPSVYAKLPFDVLADFVPITVIGYTPIVVVASNKVPASGSRQFIEWLKSRNGEATVASAGAGTIIHLANEMFLNESGTRARAVHYKGVGPMLTDLLGGHIDFCTAALPSVQGHLRNGLIKAVGIGTEQRVEAAPDIPTFAEQGLPSYIVEAWFGVLGPKGMSDADVSRVHKAFVTAFSEPEVKAAMAKGGNVINVRTPEFARQYFASETRKYADLVKRAGIEKQ
ncbi:MAG: tripartite tricarboxylate transporter substrate binding protein [Betaproteobacteria bacterium]|nr:tripartite tricarboxylate transporter substrate binding protein [Betaproteobacteria bacterium]